MPLRSSIVALCWILVFLLAVSSSLTNSLSMPFLNQSGFTTTEQRLNDVWFQLSPSFLAKFYPFDWRDGVLFLHSYYGQCQNSHLEVMAVEVPGPVFAKQCPKLKNDSLSPLSSLFPFVIIYYLAGILLIVHCYGDSR